MLYGNKEKKLMKALFKCFFVNLFFKKNNMSAQGPVIKREKGLSVAFPVCYRNITVDFM